MGIGLQGVADPGFMRRDMEQKIQQFAVVGEDLFLAVDEKRRSVFLCDPGCLFMTEEKLSFFDFQKIIFPIK